MKTLHTRATIDARDTSEEMREFAQVLRQALLMIVRYLEKRYCLGPRENRCGVEQE